MFYTSDTLITSITDRTLAPNNQATFPNSTYLNFANEEMQIKIIPWIISMREDFYLKKKTYSVTNSISKYTLPQRAIGNDIKDMFYVDSNNNRFVMPRRNIHDLPMNSTSDLYPNGFFMQDDQFVLVPTPNATTGSIEVWYYEKPSQLVLTASCGKITAVSKGATNTTFTVNTDISSYTTVDFLSGKSPFQLWCKDVSVVSATTTTVVVANTDVLDEAASSVLPQVGDYICNQLQCNIPMIPEEFHPLLSELVAARIVQALGHSEKLQWINQNIAEMRSNIMLLMGNRTEQAEEKIINRYSLDRVSGMGWHVGLFR